ncbi:DUF805 domain-containing protein [Celeribacter baekdonensis]|jgi:uncharacterized membrane protein YhaH (DUF805 family)|uniref:DUF805 domain-containing protein n=1 Tax=Celeribacter baekdonensis TaxID=875171 RepID=A0A2R4M6T9_9RHOB|nr:DUF805 domain-containing protein [Celeribacter baekdonensis]AVW92838.1 DUF805 domain-containing protein [Celeribacter baekdonensis]
MAGPLKAVENGYFRAFNFSGRASRSEFWWFSIYYAIVCGLLFIDLSKSGTLFWWFFALNIIPNLSLQVRRLHDIGKSGFWLLLCFVPFGSFVLLFFYITPSNARDNRWGPPPNGGNQRWGNGSSSNSAYAALMRVPDVSGATSEELEDARRREIQEYYKTRVLGKTV